MPTLNLTPKQSRAWVEFLDRPELSRVLFDGGARSGKTLIILAWMASVAMRYPGARMLAARKNLAHAKQTTWRILCQVLLRVAGWQRRDSDLEFRYRNGSVIRVDGLDDQERVEKILSDEYLVVFVNEATQTTWHTLTTILTRLSQTIREAPNAPRKLLLDCNPKHRRHWLYKVGIERVDPEKNEPLPDRELWGRLNWSAFDNPHLPPDYLATLQALPATMRRRMLDGVWADNEGGVYSEFDEDIHVEDRLPAGAEHWPRIASIDFGYTNPFAALLGAVDPDGRLWIVRELYRRQTLVETHAETLVRWERPVRGWWADHDAEDRATLHRRGIFTQPAFKDVGLGIQAVKVRLAVQGDGRARLIVLRACENLIREFYEYHWALPKDGRNDKEEPVKENDHALDALRYMVAALDLRRGGGIADPRLMGESR